MDPNEMNEVVRQVNRTLSMWMDALEFMVNNPKDWEHPMVQKVGEVLDKLSNEMFNARNTVLVVLGP